MNITTFNTNGLLEVSAICPAGECGRVSIGLYGVVDFTRPEADRFAADIRSASQAVERHNRPKHKWGDR